jgi:hypothetical protein
VLYPVCVQIKVRQNPWLSIPSALTRLFHRTASHKKKFHVSVCHGEAASPFGKTSCLETILLRKFSVKDFWRVR